MGEPKWVIDLLYLGEGKGFNVAVAGPDKAGQRTSRQEVAHYDEDAVTVLESWLKDMEPDHVAKCSSHRDGTPHFALIAGPGQVVQWFKGELERMHS